MSLLRLTWEYATQWQVPIDMRLLQSSRLVYMTQQQLFLHLYMFMVDLFYLILQRSIIFNRALPR